MSAKPSPCSTPPSTWLRACSGEMTRPMSCTATMRSTVISPVAASTATCAIWQPNVFTRMPSGFGPREPVPTSCAWPSLPVTSMTGSRSAPSSETNSPFDDPQVVGRDLEHVAGELEQLAAQVVGGGAHRGSDRGHRLRAARDGRVDAVARRADLDADAVERQPELLGGDHRERGRHAGADVLRARHDRDDAVVAHAHERVRRRAAAAPPDLAGGAQAAHAAVGVLAVAQRVALGPAGELGGAVDAGREVLRRCTAGR